MQLLEKREGNYNMGGGGEGRCSRKLSIIIVTFGASLLLFALPQIITLSVGQGGIRRGTALSPAYHPNHYRIQLISDLDEDSKVEGKDEYKAILKTGELVRTLKQQSEGRTISSNKVDSYEYSIKWTEDEIITSEYSEGGRGMELSELVDFGDMLLTMDDRTGIIYSINQEKDHNITVVPKHILSEGDGSVAKGMKIEWATVKDNTLYVGSFGKEFTDSQGNVVSNSPLWVVTLDTTLGNVQRSDWQKRYEKLLLAVDVPDGYLIHEAVNWSKYMKKWVLLPRRLSNNTYDPVTDEDMGTNKIIIASDDFEDIKVLEVGTVSPKRGFSTFKFLPGTSDQVIVAVKSEEQAVAEKQDSFLMVFDLQGNVLLDELLIEPGGAKFEGLEVWKI
eukprot:390551_1